MAPGSASIPPSFFIANLDVLFFSFFEMKCGPWPIGAMPVVAIYKGENITILTILLDSRADLGFPIA